MVSKVAIIAIVAILAVPIMLGYALNVEEVTETDYRTVGDSVNVTDLLKNGTGHSYTNANAYQINSEFNKNDRPTSVIYEKVASNKTSIPVNQNLNPPGGHYIENHTLSTYKMYFGQTIKDSTGGYLVLRIYKADNTTVLTVNNLYTLFYDDSTKTLTYTYKVSSTTYTTATFSNSNDYWFGFSDTGSYNGIFATEWLYGDGRPSNYADISSGYYFAGVSDYFDIELTDYTKNAILTIDLDSITDDNYTIKIGAGGHNSGANFDAATEPYYLTKTTTAGVVSWTLTFVRDTSRTWDLYYDPEVPHNTYQIYWDWNYDHTGEPYYEAGLNMYFNDIYYNSHREFRYVGNWPNAIGEANVYWKVTDDVENYYLPMPVELPDYVPSNYTDYNFSHFFFSEVSSDSQERTPTMRVDAATFVAFDYPLIENKTYDAGMFKTNPATTINKVVSYGSSFTFGGNEYTVTKGDITLGSHKIPVDGLTLSSVPNPNGGYDNKIGNTVISTTANPSSIVFNGKWSANISTLAQESYTITKTEWKAGDFAWDGIDKNFIMAGLLTSLGAFVGVGIYARRTRSSVWPLLIVCGGAALLFFVML